MPRGWSDVVCRLTQPIVRLKSNADMHRTSLSNTGLRTEAGFAVSHSALEVLIEALDDKNDLLWNAICPEYAL